jgi:hypothetical protein
MEKVDRPGQAGTEIEITDAMIEAGRATLSRSGRISPNLPDWAARELVRDILQESLGFQRRDDGDHTTRNT